MEEPEGSEPAAAGDPAAVRAVQQAAARGARRVTSRRQVVDDAVELAVARFAEALLGGRRIPDSAAWAHTVGMNAARALGAKQALAGEEFAMAAAQIVDDVERMDPGEPPGGGARVEQLQRSRRLVRARVTAQKESLRGRQFEVLMKVTEPGFVSLHWAASELGMDRSNLRRCMNSGIARLARARK